MGVLRLRRAAAGVVQDDASTGTRFAATLVLLVWVAIIFLGRFIAYDAEVWGSWSLGAHA
jgi:hypothetical protein